MSKLRPDSMFLGPPSTFTERKRARLEWERLAAEQAEAEPVAAPVKRPPRSDHIRVIEI